MNNFLRIVPTGFGALYGYLPEEKRNSRDLYKFMAITAPMASIAIQVKSMEPPKIEPAPRFIASMIWGPVLVGWYACVGSETGRMARKVLEDS